MNLSSAWDVWCLDGMHILGKPHALDTRGLLPSTAQEWPHVGQTPRKAHVASALLFTEGYLEDFSTGCSSGANQSTTAAGKSHASIHAQDPAASRDQERRRVAQGLAAAARVTKSLSEWQAAAGAQPAGAVPARARPAAPARSSALSALCAGS